MDEREFFMDVHGEGPAVVLVQGVPSAPEDFDVLVAALAGRHRVLVPHLPGYGRSAAARAPYSLVGVIASIEQRILSSNTTEAAIVAFSGGAYKAFAIALGKRLRVTRLALVSPVIGFDPATAVATRNMAEAFRSGAYDPRPSWLERMASPGFAARDPTGAARVLSWLDAAPMSLVCDELVAIAEAPDLRPRVAEFEGPLLVCAGTADRAVPPQASEALAAAARHGVYVPVEGAGHALLIEAPSRTAAIIAGFLGAD